MAFLWEDFWLDAGIDFNKLESSLIFYEVVTEWAEDSIFELEDVTHPCWDIAREPYYLGSLSSVLGELITSGSNSTYLLSSSFISQTVVTRALPLVLVSNMLTRLLSDRLGRESVLLVGQGRASFTAALGTAGPCPYHLIPQIRYRSFLGRALQRASRQPVTLVWAPTDDPTLRPGLEGFGLTQLITRSLGSEWPSLAVWSCRFKWERVTIFSHRRLLRQFFTVVWFSLLVNSSIKGTKSFMVGKLSVGGNSRSRSLSMCWGRRALSTVQLHYVDQSVFIRTSTGSLGFFWGLWF